MAGVDVVGIMKEYGKVEAQLANARRDVKELKKKLEQSEEKVSKLEQQRVELISQANLLNENNRALQDTNTKMAAWIEQAVKTVFEFCGKYKENIALPKLPACLPLAITNNFNAPIGQQVASAGCIVSDMQPKDDKPQDNNDKPDNNDKQS